MKTLLCRLLEHRGIYISFTMEIDILIIKCAAFCLVRKLL